MGGSVHRVTKRLDRNLGEHLIARGTLDQAGLARALSVQRQQGVHEPIGEILAKLGLVSEREVAEALADQLGLEIKGPAQFPDQLIFAHRIANKFLLENRIIVLADDGETLKVAMADPLDGYLLDAIRLTTGRDIVPSIALGAEITTALQQLIAQSEENEQAAESYAPGGSSVSYANDIEHLRELATEAPIIKLVNSLLNLALERKASDIHIEPFENQLLIRLRVDGQLQLVGTHGVEMAAAVISRVKLMADLNIAERRLPQDGRFKVRLLGQEIDLRVSTVPTLHGESVVLRLLKRDDVAQDLSALGFEEDLQAGVNELLGLPNGIVLVTGPTGSGKTTTLYAALRHLNTTDRKILTVEDPVEYNLSGINQIQVNTAVGLGFANALRSILRQDPDVIMVGEMRDQETARIAVQAALTGHMVLSTLHTNDAPSSVMRLLDMGVADYLLASSVSGILAQRLVRKLCPECREPYAPAKALQERWAAQLPDSDFIFHRARGCSACDQRGYSGRTMIGELLVVDAPLRELIVRRPGVEALRQAAAANGMRSMFHDGLRKVAAGQTSLEEISRVTSEL